MTPVLLAIPFGLAIGIVIGAVGGGGAILALPVLVYVLGEGVGPASTASLAVVALAAAVGGTTLARHGHVCWRLALTFTAAAAGGSVVGAVANRAVSGPVLIAAFVPVMLAAAYATWRRAHGGPAPEPVACPPLRLGLTIAAGVGVGVLTGFFGVGGGFVIVPVLTLWLGMSIRRAIATSLIIIALTALAALASHLAAGSSLTMPVAAVLAGATAVGALAGASFARRLPSAVLARGFAIVVAVVAVLLLVDVTVLHGPPGG